MSHDSVNESTPLINNSLSNPTQLRNDLDSRLNRWTSKGKAKITGKKGKGKAKEQPKVLISVFEAELDGNQDDKNDFNVSSSSGTRKRPPPIAEENLESQVQAVRTAIESGIYPKMITTGSSGSYFARVQDSSTQSIKTVAVFKPKDEEPYGELNPKRVFLRKYFWWALGRPCLLPNFSAFSEVGASFLDEQLGLNLVPRTRLIELSSPSFYYEYKDRVKWETSRVKLPLKLGSYQNFLNGYVNVSAFLRNHPWPSRPKSLMDQDLRDENRSHKKSRKKQKAHLRKCGNALKHFLLCRGEMDVDLERHEDQSIRAQEEDHHPNQNGNGNGEGLEEDSFYWTTDNMREFRLELERLVVLDYLMRNTDRGLDNFMVKILSPEERFQYDPEGKTTLVLAAIDNSLSFPHKQPDGMRDYPYGWLWFPVDLIGGPFSEQTKNQFLPSLSNAAWWNETERGLKEIFMKDEGFQEKRFEKQMTVLRGQGWNIVQCLKSEGEGPLELCARQKMLVKRDVLTMTEKDLSSTTGTRLALDTNAISTLTSNLSSQSNPTKKERESQGPLKARPMKVSGRKEVLSETINEEESLIGAQPRSLPEPDCSPWHQNQAHDHHQDKTHSRVLSENYYNKFNPNSKHGKKNAPPGLPRRPSLGIEVLEEIDRAAKKARRPTLAKSLTNLGKSRSSNDTRSINETTDDEGLVNRNLNSTSKNNNQTKLPSNQNQIPRSIEATLASASSKPKDIKAVEDSEDQDASLMASIASLPPASTRNNSANNVLEEEVRPRGRRRGLSIASFGTFGRSSSADDLHNHGTDAEDGGDQVKVIVERLETDSSKAWLSFF